MNLRLENGLLLPATVFAGSATQHDITLDDFVASLNNFSEQAIPYNTPEEIYSWREEATGEFLERMKKAGKLKHIEQTMFSGSDFGDDEDDPSESNK